MRGWGWTVTPQMQTQGLGDTGDGPRLECVQPVQSPIRVSLKGGVGRLAGELRNGGLREQKLFQGRR